MRPICAATAPLLNNVVVVEFLVLDRLFPRSVFAALVQAETCLSELDPTAGRTGVDDAARRALGRARTDLEFRVSEELLHDLPGLLDVLQRTCAPAHLRRECGGDQRPLLPPHRRAVLDRRGERMSWRLRIRHTTGYRYDTEVASSYNEARLAPQTELSQLTIESSVMTSPGATQQRYWGYWGTQVTAFDVHEPHAEPEVTATSLVDTSDPREPEPVTWSELDAARDLHAELLVPSTRTVPDAELVELAAQARSRQSPYEVVLALSATVRDRVA